MDPGTDGDIRFSRPDGKAVFDDVFAFGNRLQGHFMPCRDVLADRKVLPPAVTTLPLATASTATATLS